MANVNVYRVIVSTTRTFSTIINAFGTDEQDAGKNALALARASDPHFTADLEHAWSEDDYSPEPPYEVVSTMIEPESR